MVNTQWERIESSGRTMEYLRHGQFQIWSRLSDGKHIFLVLTTGQLPGSNDGGYFSIQSALKAKGLF
jgi:hypothetical protein